MAPGAGAPLPRASRTSPCRRRGAERGGGLGSGCSAAPLFISSRRPSRCWRLRTINSSSPAAESLPHAPGESAAPAAPPPDRYRRSWAGGREGCGGSCRWLAFSFLVFPAGSGASGQIRSRESVPAKSLPFIPLSSFLRSPPGGRAPGGGRRRVPREPRRARGDPG